VRFLLCCWACCVHVPGGKRTINKSHVHLLQNMKIHRLWRVSGKAKPALHGGCIFSNMLCLKTKPRTRIKLLRRQLFRLLELLKLNFLLRSYFAQ
jgi:hypothetical protein